MGPKQILFALIFFVSATFLFQMPKLALGFGESRSEIRSNDDQRLALNKVEFRQLMKLEGQLKSKEAKLAKLKSKKKKKKKKKRKTWGSKKRSSSGSDKLKEKKLKAEIKDLKKQIAALGGLGRLYNSDIYRTTQLNKLQKELASCEKKLVSLDDKIARAKKSRWPKIKKQLSSSKKKKNELLSKIKDIKKEIRKVGGSC